MLRVVCRRQREQRKYRGPVVSRLVSTAPSMPKLTYSHECCERMSALKRRGWAAKAWVCSQEERSQCVVLRKLRRLWRGCMSLWVFLGDQWLLTSVDDSRHITLLHISPGVPVAYEHWVAVPDTGFFGTTFFIVSFLSVVSFLALHSSYRYSRFFTPYG